jgi:hypothetical protein
MLERVYGVPGHVWMLAAERRGGQPWERCDRCGVPYVVPEPAHCLPTAAWAAANPDDDGRCHCAEHAPGKAPAPLAAPPPREQPLAL